MRHKLIRNLLLTGASGWFGKSFIYEGYKIFGSSFLKENYFVASKARLLNVPGIPIPVSLISFEDAKNLTKVDYFVQSAFITRDKIDSLGKEGYISENQKIIDMSFELSRALNPDFHVLISSGAVTKDSSLYGILKTVEEHRVLTGSAKDKKLFRVYGASGLFLPDIQWSALSQFVKCFHAKETILINSSGRILRSLIDFGDLSNIILKYFVRREIYPVEIIDACNIEIDLVDVAQSISKLGDINLVLPPSFDIKDTSSDYRGDTNELIKFATFVEHELTELDEQIERSINSLEFRGYTYKQL